MPVFPLFVDLKDKKCVVIGGGNTASRKIDTLLKFDVRITVISPEVTQEILELKFNNRLIIIKKKYSDEDIEDAFLVIAATSDENVNEKIYNDAVKKNIFVNVVDCPQKCTFLFPSVLKRNDLVIGISTSGSYPALSKNIREKLEGIFPEFYGEMLKILKEYRNKSMREVSDSEKRTEFLNRILDEVTFYEDALTVGQIKRRLEEILGEYVDEKGNQSRNP